MLAGFGSPQPFPGFLPRANSEQADASSAENSASRRGSGGAAVPRNGGLLAATSVFIRSLSPFASLSPEAGGVPAPFAAPHPDTQCWGGTLGRHT